MTWSDEQFEARLRGVGEEHYHDKHPFNLRMHAGALSREEIQIWVRNRYYYQTRIPIKDGLILAKSGDPEFRREWIQRIHDHDGEKAGDGGIELWIALGASVGLTREDILDPRGILPGVRAACDDYVRFVESHDLLESVAASLTEMFAGNIMHVRIAAFEEHYPWVDTEGLRYFRSRTTQAPRDAENGLAFVTEYARTEEDQARCVAALERKCEILWNLLDAVVAGCSRPVLSNGALLRDDPAEGGSVAVLPERAVKLNATGRTILDLCDGNRSAVAIAAHVRERHTDAEDGIESDTHAFLAEMRKLGVIRFAT